MKDAGGRLLPPLAGWHRVRDVALAGAVIVGGLALAIAISVARSDRATQRSAVSQGPATSASTVASVPESDVAAAGVAPAARLVTPLWLEGRRGAAGITLIGAYADSAQVVMFFRGLSAGPPSFFVYDEQTWLNSYTGGGPGIQGDMYSSLATSPHVGANGLAHLTITDSAPASISGPTKPVGNQWFSFSLKVQPGIPLSAPSAFPLGSWQVKVEKLEATPTVIVLERSSTGLLPRTSATRR